MTMLSCFEKKINNSYQMHLVMDFYWVFDYYYYIWYHLINYQTFSCSIIEQILFIFESTG